MTQMSVVTAAELDRLAYRGWPALETKQIGRWVARAAEGVTRRANCVLTSGTEPSSTDVSGTDTSGTETGLDDAIDAVEAFYAERGLPATFQIGDASVPESLADSLALRGYRREGETLVQVASLATLQKRLMEIVPSAELDDITVTGQPDDAWLRMWWSVDGRGGAQDLEVARKIMGGSPALYAAIHDETGVTAGARLALVDDWGALFALVVRPNARRKGLATYTLAALVADAQKRGVTRLCLQVLATSHGALAFYESLGFETASHYRYWVAPTTPAGR